MAPRIDPALPLVWRSPTELQLGGLTPRVVMRDPGGLETGLVAALRHGASTSTLRTIGAGLDGTPAEVDRVLELLAPAFYEPTDVSRPASDGPTGLVVVDAEGEVARLLLANLGALGHRAVGVDDADAGDLATADVAVAVVAAAWVVPPARHLPWLRRDVPHLSVVDDERGITIGPLVEPGRGPCLRCIELARRDADTAWPAIAAQPRQVPRGWNHPCRGDHDEGDVSGGIDLTDVVEPDGVVSERREVREQQAGDLAVGIDDDATGGAVACGARGIGHGVEGRREHLEHPIDLGRGTVEPRADRAQRREARAVSQCGEETGLEAARVAHDDAGVQPAELQFSGRAPHEGECRVDARGHVESMPESA